MLNDSHLSQKEKDDIARTKNMKQQMNDLIKTMKRRDTKANIDTI